MVPTVPWCSSACVESAVFLNHHNAPAVSYPTGRSGYLSLALCGVLLLGALSAGLYIVGTNTPNKPLVWQLSLIAFAWLFSALGVLRFLRQLPVGELDFDGTHWYFAEKVGGLSVRFDGQSCLLARFEDDLQNANWVWLEARFDPTRWHDLRRAVYSRAESLN